MNGYNFTDEARSTLTASREAAARLNHNYVGTEHVLWALIDQKNAVLSKALQHADSTLDALLRSLERSVPHAESSEVPKARMDMPYTSRAKKILELAMTEARDRGDVNVTSSHILLGLIREERGIGAQLLTHVGVTVDVVRAILPIPAIPPIPVGHQAGDRMMAFSVKLNPSPYILLSGLIFAAVAIAQLTRIVMRWPLLIAGVSIPMWASVVAFFVAGGLAVWALRVRRW
jgi:hypothetical protein